MDTFYPNNSTSVIYPEEKNLTSTQYLHNKEVTNGVVLPIPGSAAGFAPQTSPELGETPSAEKPCLDAFLEGRCWGNWSFLVASACMPRADSEGLSTNAVQ